MATVIKKNARKPLIEDGRVYTGSYVGWKPAEPGFVRSTGVEYTAVFGPPDNTGKGPEYEFRLTEEQMLDTVAQWLTAYNSNRRREANAKRKK